MESTVKKGLHLIIAILLAVSVTGQPVNEKTHINAFHKPLDFENLHDFLSKGEKHVIQNPQKLNASKVNQSKSALADVQNLDSTISKSWDTTTSQWVVSGKSKYNYDANGNNTLYIEYDWDKTTSKWVAAYKREYTFDAKGNIILIVNYQWDVNTSNWVGSYKQENTYDANGNETLYIYYHLDKTTSKLVGDYNITYYYSEHNFIPKTPETHINVYPNPASEYIVFDVTNISDYATVEIFDNQGKKVLEQKLPVTGQIFISKLSKGLYLYRINNDGTIYKGKIIVE
jgi:hypothetical protein